MTVAIAGTRLFLTAGSALLAAFPVFPRAAELPADGARLEALAETMRVTAEHYRRQAQDPRTRLMPGPHVGRVFEDLDEFAARHRPRASVLLT